MKIGKDLVAAAATPLVLGILADEASYGYAILKRVSEVSEGEWEWTDGMLYPLLHRLERLGHVESFWGVSEEGRRRRNYRITAEGRGVLAEQRAQWLVVSTALRKIWDESSTAFTGPAGLKWSLS